MEKTEEQQKLEQQGLADFEAGFNGEAARTEPETVTAPEIKPETADESVQTATEVKPPEATGAAEAEEPMIAGMTASQVRDLLSKAAEVDKLREEIHKVRDTAAGKYGELNRTIQGMQKQPDPEKLTLTKAAEYNDEFASALAADLDGKIGGMKPEEVQELLKAEREKMLTEVEQQFEVKMLLRQHKDFYDQLETPDFKLWLTQQKPEDQKEFGDSWDSDYLAGRMTEFKSWRQGLNKKQDNQRRLEQAVQPKGGAVTTGALTAEQEFEAGFYGKRA